MKPLNSYSLQQTTKTITLLKELLAGAAIRGTIPTNFQTRKAA